MIEDRARTATRQRLRSYMTAAAFAVGTGDNHDVAIGVAEPNFPVLGRRVDVRFFDDLRLQPARALDSQIEIVELEPQHDAVSGRRRVGVDEIGVLFGVPGVQLEEQSPRAPDPIVHVAVRVIGKRVGSEQFGVPVDCSREHRAPL